MDCTKQCRQYTLVIHPIIHSGQTINKKGGDWNMAHEKQVPLMISVPVEIRTRLRTMAAQRNLKHPEKVTSAAEIAREIILNNIEKTK